MADDSVDRLMATEELLARRLAGAEAEAREIVAAARKDALASSAVSEQSVNAAVAEVSDRVLAAKDADVVAVRLAAAAEVERLQSVPEAQLHALAVLVLCRLSAGDAGKEPA